MNKQTPDDFLNILDILKDLSKITNKSIEKIIKSMVKGRLLNSYGYSDDDLEDAIKFFGSHPATGMTDKEGSSFHH